MTTARCTVQSFALHNYPSRETLDRVVDELAPVQLVSILRDEGTAASFDGVTDCFVRTLEGDRIYTLYDGTDWLAPEHSSEEVVQRVHQRTARADHRSDAPTEYGFSLPLPERAMAVDLIGEGLDIDAIRDRLSRDEPSRSQPTDTMPDSTNGASENGHPTESLVEPSQAIDVAAGTSLERATAPGYLPRNRYQILGTHHPGQLSTLSFDGQGQAMSLLTSLSFVLDRLDHIETAIGGHECHARVVDAGDDVCLFRIEDPPSSFEHGQSVRVVLDANTADSADE